MSPAPPTPVERVAMYVAALSRTVASHTGWDQILTLSLIEEIIRRLREIKWAFARIADRIQAGTWRPRRTTPRQPSASAPRPPIPRRKKFGWLRPLLPEAVPYSGHLFDMLQDARMQALLEGAPPALGRPLRSLCWMLGIKPPSFLPRRPPPPPKPPAPPAQRPPPPAAPPPSPRVRAAPARAKIPTRRKAA